MERKLGVNSHCLKGVAEADALPILKNAGFDCFFSGVYTPEAVQDLKKRADEVGIDFAFIHAPWNELCADGKRVYMNELWKHGIGHISLFNKVKTAIDSAAAADVKTVCMHLTEGWRSPLVTEIGLSRFDDIVAHAVKRGVKLAFENIYTLGALALLMERYERVPEVGFCYDNGHAHCYTETVPFLDLYGKRTLCTHIHDNFGRDKEDPMKDADYHLLPFDGNFDFADMMQKLDKYGYEGALTLEVWQQGAYGDMMPEAFAAHLVGLAKRVANAHRSMNL
ncbi:MAG: sugar phosphate isomerase/epimerase [Clostridia bacterium]|nr:sugar phosphate isomerase/epimerase [Clostridia bacterium]